MSTNGAQIRLVYEYIHSTNGQWMKNTSSWVDATSGQLKSFQESVAKQIHRADRRNFHIEYRRFSTEVCEIGVGTNWETLAEIIERGGDGPEPTWCVIVGTPAAGFHVYGPFVTSSDASNYADDTFESDWWTVDMRVP